MTERKGSAHPKVGRTRPRREEQRPYEHPKGGIPEQELAGIVSRAREDHGSEARELLVTCALTEIRGCADELASDWLDAMDLYQEGAVAVISAVDDFLLSQKEGSTFRSAMQQAIRSHLEKFIAEEEAAKNEREQLVRDVELLDKTFVELKRELGREPLVAEVAAKLSWTARKVTVVGEALERAREEFDLDILQYLDPDIAGAFVEDLEPGLSADGDDDIDEDD